MFFFVVDFDQVKVSWLNDSNAEFLILKYYVPFLENAPFYVIKKASFLFAPPKEFHYQFARSVLIW